MLRKIFAVLLVSASVFVASSAGLFMNLSQNIARAQSANPCSVPRSTECYRQNRAAYEAAISNCTNPSLECLVFFTTNYAAIEWLENILGQSSGNASCTPGAPGCGTSDSGGSGSGGNETKVATGAVTGLGQMIGMMYATPVAQTGPYIADLMESARLAPPAYAQGLGFAALNPVLNLWKIFRNLSYVFFVIIMMVIGFLIMLRKKVGQAAITAQQAIPNIVISMLFVTFSYAIAGFLIDLMYVAMFLIIGLFETTAGFQDNIINYDIITLMMTLFKGAGDLSTTSNVVETFISSDGSNAVSSIIGFIGGLTLSLVVAVAVLIGTFKLFFELLRAYATVVLATVTAPIVLMFGAIPGNNAFGKWIKQIVGNLLPFPTVLLVVVMFYFFTQGGVTGEGGFMPPFLLGRGQISTITSLMGFAIILALPDIVKHVRENVAGKGGFGEMVAGWGIGNAKKGLDMAETGLPLAGGAIGGLSGAGLAGYKARKEGKRGREFWDVVNKGYEQVDPRTGAKKQVGGFSNWGRIGINVGSRARRTIDDIKEGRFADPNNLYRRLEELQKSQGKPASGGGSGSGGHGGGTGTGASTGVA